MKKLLYSWGANSHGQLGLGHVADILEPAASKLQFTPAQIAGGGRHSTLLSDCQKCFACGCNDQFQLGVDSTQEAVKDFVNIILPKGVKTVSSGWDYTFAVLDDTSLYSWGTNSYGQLGLELACFVSKPTLVLTDGVELVAAGLRHSICLKKNGDVLTCGFNKKGELGSNQQSNSLKQDFFKQVLMPSGSGRVIHVVAGAYHSAALTDNGQVIVWGCNRFGQLARDPSACKMMAEPTLISQTCFNNEPIIKLASGWTHQLALTEKGHLYSWGRADYGQLGRQSDVTCSHWTPASVESLSCGFAKEIACGSEHNLVLNRYGEVYSWGWNEHGMCGSGDENNVLKPTRINSLTNIITIASGAGHSFAISA